MCLKLQKNGMRQLWNPIDWNITCTVSPDFPNMQLGTLLIIHHSLLRTTDDWQIVRLAMYPKFHQVISLWLRDVSGYLWTFDLSRSLLRTSSYYILLMYAAVFSYFSCDIYIYIMNYICVTVMIIVIINVLFVPIARLGTNLHEAMVVASR